MAAADGDDQLTRTDRREQYEHVLRIVEHNTGAPGRPQPAIIEVGQITLHAGSAGIDARTAKKRIRAAVENDDLLKVQHRGVVRNTREGLQAALGEVYSQQQTIVDALEGADDE